MSIICRLFGHRWNGCTCTRCGMNRYSEHSFRPGADPCTEVCEICGSQRETHRWSGTACHSVCEKCGKTVDSPHRWVWKDDRIVCTVCGATKHRLVSTINQCPVSEYRCTVCGRVGGTNDASPYGCDFVKEPCNPD
jgi:DNA-directed RNA polymerase subunit RPC12/RpoP